MGRFSILRTLYVRLVVLLGAGLALLAVAWMLQSNAAVQQEVAKSQTERISAIAVTLAPHVNGDLHETMALVVPHKDGFTRWSLAPAPVQLLREGLTRALHQNRVDTPIYTLRLREDYRAAVQEDPDVVHPEAMEFFVSTSDTPYWRHTYKYQPSMGPTLFQGQSNTVPMYHDENGTWISAYAPIKNANGQVVALLEVDATLDTVLEKAQEEQRQRATTVIGSIFAMLLVLALAIQRTTRSISTLAHSADRFGKGDFQSSIQARGSSEVEQLAGSLEYARASIATHMESQLSILAEVSRTSSDLNEAAQVLAKASGRMQSSETASDGSGKLRQRVQGMDVAVTELNGSIAEIARNALDAARVASSAVGQANQAAGSIQELGETGQHIEEAVKRIAAIAEQTNLVAINATIEAARVGEAGKGFAVVANEVQNLAAETAEFTKEISSTVAGINDATQRAVVAMEEFTETVDLIHEYQASIASAVEEQTATTAEMRRSMGQAVAMCGSIDEAIGTVAQLSSSAQVDVVATGERAMELSHLAENLKHLLDAHAQSQEG